MVNLTEKTPNIWKEIKNQPIDIWFFGLFLLTFTLQVRKVVFFFPLEGAFNEYTSVYIYASDIFLSLAILARGVSILYNKKYKTSSSEVEDFRLIHKIGLIKKSKSSVINKLSTSLFYFYRAFFIILSKATVSVYHIIVPRGTFLEKSEETLQDEFRKMFHVEQFNDDWSKAGLYFRAIFLGLIFIMLFDHYLWDIWQGQVLFWLVCGILVGVSYDDGSKKCSTWNIFSIPLFLVIWSFVSSLWSENNLVAIYKSVKFIELYILFIYISIRFVPYCKEYVFNCSTWNKYGVYFHKIVPRGTISGSWIFLLLIAIVGLLQSIIGISQFIAQNSLGLIWLKESLIGQDIAGVAKIIVNNKALIRAYGLFPHPNILGGFLFFSTMVTLLYSKLFHVEQLGVGVEKNSIQENCNCSTWNNHIVDDQKKIIVPRGTIWRSWKEKAFNFGNFINILLVIQVFGILLSFSKSAILALVVALIYINVPRGTFSDRRGKISCDEFDDAKYKDYAYENCSTWNNFSGKIFKLFHVEQFRVGLKKSALFAGLLASMVLVLAYFKFNFWVFFIKSWEERNIYLAISQRIIADSPIFGVGTGQFVMLEEKLFSDLAIWQYQPVHNVFLLIWSEWGIIGLVLFILFLWKLFVLSKDNAENR